MCMKKKKHDCFGCFKSKKLNSRGYCVSCWNQHQDKVTKAKRLTGLKARVLKRWSLQGLIENGF